MGNSSSLAKASGVFLGSLILISASAIPQVGALTASGQTKSAAFPSCSGIVVTHPPAHPPKPASPTPHSVTLSWNASVPASKEKPDSIQGYYVYRSLKSQTYAESDRISTLPLPGTQCVDTAVVPRTTYYYAIKALSLGGAKSDFSKEATAVIPFP